MVVTIASLAAYVTAPQLTDYAATKAGALAFHEGLAGELQTRYNAPGVRTLCICPNWARTKLSEGFVNNSKFVSPTLYPETIAEAVVEGVLKGSSGVIHLPRVHEWFASTIRGMPWWLQAYLRNSTKDSVKDGMGRQPYLMEEEGSKEKGAEKAEEKEAEAEVKVEDEAYYAE